MSNVFIEGSGWIGIAALLAQIVAAACPPYSWKAFFLLRVPLFVASAFFNYIGLIMVFVYCGFGCRSQSLSWETLAVTVIILAINIAACWLAWRTIPAAIRSRSSSWHSLL